MNEFQTHTHLADPSLSEKLPVRKKENEEATTERQNTRLHF